MSLWRLLQEQHLQLRRTDVWNTDLLGDPTPACQHFLDELVQMVTRAHLLLPFFAGEARRWTFLAALRSLLTFFAAVLLVARGFFSLPRVESTVLPQEL